MMEVEANEPLLNVTSGSANNDRRRKMKCSEIQWPRWDGAMVGWFVMFMLWMQIFMYSSPADSFLLLFAFIFFAVTMVFSWKKNLDEKFLRDGFEVTATVTECTPALKVLRNLVSGCCEVKPPQYITTVSYTLPMDQEQANDTQTLLERTFPSKFERQDGDTVTVRVLLADNYRFSFSLTEDMEATMTDINSRQRMVITSLSLVGMLLVFIVQISTSNFTSSISIYLLLCFAKLGFTFLVAVMLWLMMMDKVLYGSETVSAAEGRDGENLEPDDDAVGSIRLIRKTHNASVCQLLKDAWMVCTYKLPEATSGEFTE